MEAGGKVNGTGGEEIYHRERGGRRGEVLPLLTFGGIVGLVGEPVPRLNSGVRLTP